MPAVGSSGWPTISRRAGGSAAGTASALAGWAAVAGLEVDVDGRRAGPHAEMHRGDWQAAADGFGELGWGYDRGADAVASG